MTINAAIHAFQEHLKRTGYSELTGSTYLRNIRQLVTFLDAFYPRIKDVAAVTRDVLIDYQDYLWKWQGFFLTFRKKFSPIWGKAKIPMLRKPEFPTLWKENFPTRRKGFFPTCSA